jgi:hypothetical protein
MTHLAHYALLSVVVLVALNLAALALLVWRWWAEESYAREWDARREPERARMDAAMSEPTIHDAVALDMAAVDLSDEALARWLR